MNDGQIVRNPGLHVSQFLPNSEKGLPIPGSFTNPGATALPAKLLHLRIRPQNCEYSRTSNAAGEQSGGAAAVRSDQLRL